MITVSLDFPHVVVPTLEVVAAWTVLTALLIGMGLVVRRLLAVVGATANPPHPMMGDVWLGLCAVSVYIETWNLGLPIQRSAWIAPVVVALFGLAPSARRAFARRTWRSGWAYPLDGARASLATAGVFAAIMWLGNRTLAAESDYDDGLYHLGIVRYSMDHRTLPGLANLHERLGAADPNLLLVSLVSRASSLGAAVHLVNGLLAVLLLLDCGLRLTRPAEAQLSPFTTALARFVAAATVIVVAIDPGVRISSANLDFATYALVAGGLLYLAQAIESRDSRAAAVALALLSLAAANRPLYWICVLIALAAVALRWRRAGASGGVRMFTAISALPVLIAVVWATSQAVLSGYPFFPLTIVRLPVDWRVPRSDVVGVNRWISSWARHPGLQPDAVLGSWHWLRWWLPQRIHDADAVAPLALLIVTLRPRAFARQLRDPRFSDRSAAMLSVLVPTLVTVVIWFLSAPDPRFALAPIWFIPISFAAFGIAGGIPRPNRWPLGRLFLLVVAGLAVGAALGNRIYVIAVIAIAIGTFVVVADIADSREKRSAITRLATPVILSVTVGVISMSGVFGSVVSQPDGVFGMTVTVPSVSPFRTKSGVALVTPKSGDQCWAVPLCTPTPNPSLALRGAGLSSGFRTGR